LFWGIWEKSEIRNEQRAVKVGFLDLGGLYRTVVQHREEKIVDKPAVSLGQRQSAPRQTHR